MAESKTIRLRVGDEHTIHLESLMPAGYEWQPELEGDNVAQVTKSTEEAADERAVGAGPDEIVKIKAVRPGSTRIRLAQRRPWEQGAAAANEEIYELHVVE